MMDKETYKNNIVLAGYRGSMAHGTYIENHIDDIDIMGISILPENYYLGFRKKREQFDWFEDKYDYLIYEIRKYFSLLSKGNPNVISLLWNDDEFYTQITDIGRKIIENRDLFLSKEHIYNSFKGYAYSQLKGIMKGDYYKGYMGAKRKELFKEFGFDPKHASHCIRLLKMGIEVLRDGKFYVYREYDKNELLDIKQGKWGLQRIEKYANELFEKFETAYNKSTLQNKCDINQIQELMIWCMKEHWNK